VLFTFSANQAIAWLPVKVNAHSYSAIAA
jgi:hypothetical protein